MYLRVLAPVLLAALLPAAAMAGINTTRPLGPMNLYIDDTGAGMMVNDGAAAFMFDGYTITSDGGLLDPARIHGICDRENWIWLGWPEPFPPVMFPEYCTWAEISSTPYVYAEVTMEVKLATLQPGDSIVLGTGFLGGTQADMTFTYVNSTLPVGQTSFEGAVIPEPGTLSLLICGTLASFRRRR